MNMQTTSLPKSVESKVQARFPDCDPFNHLNNSKYIDYIINTREDHLMSAYNFDLHQMARTTGITWVVAQTNISYMLPVNCMETVTIETRLLTAFPKMLLMEAVMWNEDKTKVKAMMWCYFAHYNLRTGKSQEHSAELMTFFDQIGDPIPDNPSFEERAKFYRNINNN